MRFTAEFLAKAVAGSARESAALFPVLRKCAAAGAAKSKAAPHADDIAQELWLFLKKNSQRLDESYNIEPYLIETARKMSLAYNRKYSFFGTEGTDDKRADGMCNLAGAEVVSHEEATDSLLEATDQDLAMQYLLKESPALRAAAGSASDPEEDPDMLKRAHTLKRKAELSEEQKKLREWRLEGGLSQVEMADRVGIKLSTYQAYEYGKTKSVPIQVMESARNVKANPQFSYVQKLYRNKSMGQVANEWLARLGLPPDSVTELAQVLNIEKSTVSRWFNPRHDIVPTPETIATHERRINAEERWIKSRDRRHKAH